MSARFTVLLTLVCSFFLAPVLHAAEPIWKDLKAPVSGQRLWALDREALLQQLDVSTGTRGAARRSLAGGLIELPLPDGGSVKLHATEYSVMEPGAVAVGSFRSWKVAGVDDPAVSGVIDLSSNGFNAMLLMGDGETVFIKPSVSSSEGTDAPSYLSLKKTTIQADSPFQCGVHTASQPVSRKQPLLPEVLQKVSRSVKTYRLAVAATGEFTQFYGDRTRAMDAISTMINQINLIYERDLSIQLVLVANNFSLVFPDPATDPYPDNTDSGLLSINTSVLNQVIGSTAYDIGHVVTRLPARQLGGIADLESVCTNTKGSGMTGSADPSQAAFAIDFVAHEIGHQLGATHTFNSTSLSCGEGNREAVTAYEPGSGSSVMAYAGICGVNNIASNTLPVFHLASIAQIDAVTNAPGDCATETPTTNQDPVIDTVSSLTVNAGEPFTLTASASDPDNDVLTYNWDQFDAGKASDKFIDAGDNALFEVTLPSVSASRTFPGLAKTNRVLTFEVVVRDGKGGITNQRTTVNVVNGDAPPADLFPLSGNTAPSTGTLPSSDNGGGGSLSMTLLLSLFLFTMLCRKRMPAMVRRRITR